MRAAGLSPQLPTDESHEHEHDQNAPTPDDPMMKPEQMLNVTNVEPRHPNGEFAVNGHRAVPGPPGRHPGGAVQELECDGEDALPGRNAP